MSDESEAPKTAEVERLYSEDELDRMKMEGLPKPDNVAWSQWNGPRRLNSRHHLIAYLAATGMKTTAIAKEVGLTLSRVSTLLSSPRIRAEIQFLQKQMFGLDPKKRIQGMFEKSMQTIENVLDDPEEKGATKLTAAIHVSEHVLGKAKQHVEVGGNLLRDLFERMDQKKREMDAIDVTAKPSPKFLPEIESQDTLDSIEAEEVPSVESAPEDPPKPKSEVDAWIESTLIKPK